MERGGCVYIMANKRNGTLYTGVTSQLAKRIWEHREHAYSESFTVKYRCNMLVYYRAFDRIEEAILEEKRIKGGSRRQKLQLIEELNPDWKNLWDEIKDYDF